MPADRAFGQVERKIKPLETVYTPEEYDEIVKSVGNLFIVNSDVQIKDHKTEASSVLKADKGFLISDSKVLSYSPNEKGEIQTRKSYSSAPETSSIIKKKDLNKVYNPPIVPAKNNASSAKLKDVLDLLEKMGVSPSTVEFYAPIHALYVAEVEKEAQKAKAAEEARKKRMEKKNAKKKVSFAEEEYQVDDPDNIACENRDLF